MDRRRFLLTSLAGALAAPLAAEAQTTRRRWQIAVLGSISPEVDKALIEGLTRLDLVDGQDFTVQPSSPYTTLPEAGNAVATLLDSDPHIVVAWGAVGAIAAKKAAPITLLPIVFLSVDVPVEIGLVSSLSRPGGNMTGVTFEASTETYAKRLQLLKDVVVPHLSRVAVLHAGGDPAIDHAIKSAQSGASGLGVQLRMVSVNKPDDLDSAFATMKTERAQGVLVVAGALTFTNGSRIAKLTLDNRLPSSHAFREAAAAGGLISLGPNFVAMTIQGAGYIAKIIRGARSAELPVEQPTKHDVVINLKTAKALGLTIPPSLLTRADQVIE